MSYRRKLLSAAVLAGAALPLLAWVAQAQQEPPRGNDPPGAFQDASSTDLSLCFPPRHQTLLRAGATDPADPTVMHLGPRMALVLGVLLILVLHLSALIVWPVAAVVRRAGSRPRAAAPKGFPRLTAGAVIALSVGFWWWVRASLDLIFALLMVQLPHVVSRLLFLELHSSGHMDWVGPGQLRWLADDVARNCEYPPWILPLFYVPYLTAVATVYVLYLAFRSWREKWWTGLGRLHYTIVAITLAWYPFHLYSLGFIL